MLIRIAGFIDRIAEKAARRNLEDGTVGPVLTWTTDGMLGHVEWLLKIPGEPSLPHLVVLSHC